MPRAQQPSPRATNPTAALAPAPPNFFLGTSGWAYPTWKPGFYPPGVPARAFLEYYASRFTSVEVNYTFTKLPTPQQITSWLEATPPGFRFSFKAPQRITHFERLLGEKSTGTQNTLVEFLTALAPARKAGKLGAILFQLPPNFKADLGRLRAFLALPAFRRKQLQLAFEFRHPDWFTLPVYEILTRAGAALCIAESDTLATPEIHTAPHVYFRLRCNGCYPKPRIQSLAAEFADLSRTREVFAYFKHEDEPTGARNALQLLGAANKLLASHASLPESEAA